MIAGILAAIGAIIAAAIIGYLYGTRAQARGVASTHAYAHKHAHGVGTYEDERCGTLSRFIPISCPECAKERGDRITVFLTAEDAALIADLLDYGMDAPEHVRAAIDKHPMGLRRTMLEALHAANLNRRPTHPPPIRTKRGEGWT